MSKAAEDWNFIVNSFGRLINDNDNRTEILSIERGSLLLTIAIVSGIIAAITKSSNQIMDSVLKALSIKQKVLELRKMGLDNEIAELDVIDRRADIKMKEIAKEVTTSLMDEYQPNKESDSYNETKGFVERSVEMIVVFNAQGGKLEPKLIEPTPDTAKNTRELNEKSVKYDNLKNTINQIENGKAILRIEGYNENERDNKS